MAGTPTFLIIGAARAGTTALYDLLQQHPQISMSTIKEPNFFAFEGEPLDWCGPGNDFVNNSISSWNDYSSLFEMKPGAIACGEASPLYLWAPHAAKRIKARLPDVKLIAVLRNPIDQAFSHYLYARAQMIEPIRDFSAALEAEPQRLAARWQPLFQYSDFPRYATQLRRYCDEFSADQIQLFLYEDFRENPKAMLRKIFAFIGVDASFEPNVTVETNLGGQPRHAWLQRLVMRPNFVASLSAMVVPMSARRKIRDRVSRRNLARDHMPEDARVRLQGLLKEDILQLQDMIGRDLSHWLRA